MARLRDRVIPEVQRNQVVSPRASLIDNNRNRNGSRVQLHNIVHVIVIDPNNKIVAHERAMHGHGYHPGSLNAGVIGHIEDNENPLIAAKREIREELGLVIRDSDLKEMGKFELYEKLGDGRQFQIYATVFILRITEQMKANIRVDPAEVVLGTMSEFTLDEARTQGGRFTPIDIRALDIVKGELLTATAAAKRI